MLDEPVLALLADPAMWERPGDACRSAVVAIRREPGRATVTDLAAHPRRGRARPRSRAIVLAGTAVAAAVALVAVFAGAHGGTVPRRTSAELAGPAGPVELRASEDTAGWAVTVEAGSLPDPGPGALYELWLVGPAGTTSAGTFRAGGDVHLWTGLAKIGGLRALVTREVVPGGPGRDGPVVASATLPVPR